MCGCEGTLLLGIFVSCVDDLHTAAHAMSSKIRQREETQPDWDAQALGPVGLGLWLGVGLGLGVVLGWGLEQRLVVGGGGDTEGWDGAAWAGSEAGWDGEG